MGIAPPISVNTQGERLDVALYAITHSSNNNIQKNTYYVQVGEKDMYV